MSPIVSCKGCEKRFNVDRKYSKCSLKKMGRECAFSEIMPTLRINRCLRNSQMPKSIRLRCCVRNFSGQNTVSRAILEREVRLISSVFTFRIRCRPTSINTDLGSAA
ncbi:hypothetical protein CEXT_76641 [Caerostris extrusa]|uniref:Uncharacterized protein n=1 Tax=Caerostris extrusa TaxID=172846 RepID=A0AAV4MZH8_CAEEX|nr:hypothetical protein CEXT_76641 [Caerostris extrusa]